MSVNNTYKKMHGSEALSPPCILLNLIVRLKVYKISFQQSILSFSNAKLENNIRERKLSEVCHVSHVSC